MTLRSWHVAFICMAAVAMAAPSSRAAITPPFKTISVGKLPGPLAANPATHTVFVVNQGSNSVSAIDTFALKVVKTIAVGSAPLAIAANPPAGMVYVANSGDGTISAISGTSNAKSWSTGGKPMALAVDVALNQLYVADTAQDQIEVLNAKTGASVANVPLGKTPTALAIDIAAHRLWVACTGTSGAAIVIDGKTNSIAKTIGSLAPDISSVSVDPVTAVAILVSPTTDTYIAIDPGNNYAVHSSTGDKGAAPIATAYDPGNGLFYFVDSGDGNIFFSVGDGLIHLGNAYSTSLRGGKGIAIDPTTNQMAVNYYTNDNTGAAELIDLENPLFPEFYHLLSPGKKPDGLAFDPLANRLFISVAANNTVTVYNNSPQIVTAALECSCGGDGVDAYNFIDTNPVTGTTYTLRLGNLYAIDEAKAGAGTSGSGDGVTTIPLGSVYPQALAVNAATNKIYVGDTQGLFYVVDGRTNTATLVTSVPPTADIRSIAVDGATNKIVAWDYINNVIDVLDSTTDALVHTIPLIANSSSTLVVVDSAKDRAYVASNEVSVVNPSSGTLVTTVMLGQLTNTALQVVFNPADSRLYIYSNDNKIYVFDTANDNVAAVISPAGLSITSVGVNPVTGRWYVGGVAGDATRHVLIYDGATNALTKDLSNATNPAITNASTISSNPLTNTMYVGTNNGNSTAAAAVIDGRTNAVSALPPSSSENDAYALTTDLGSNLLAGAGYSFTNLWFPTSDLSGTAEVPIAVKMAGIPDGGTIATTPIFRTHTTNPRFTLSATSQGSGDGSALVPTSAYWQVDGWQGTWKAATLKTNGGSKTAHAKIALPALTTGRHILYAYAATGDVATIQDNRGGGNSPVTSRIAAVVFTVEK